MKWRISVALLWLLAGLYAGAVLTAMFDLHAVVTPTLAFTGPILVAVGALAVRRSAARRDLRETWTPEDVALPAAQTGALETTGSR